MGKSLGIAAFVLLLISFPIPIVGNILSILALILASFSAIGGERTWPIVVGIVGGIKMFFMSPSWIFLMYSHKLVEGAGAFGDSVADQQRSTNTFYFYFTLLVVLLPIAIALYKQFSGLPDEAASPKGDD